MTEDNDRYFLITVNCRDALILLPSGIRILQEYEYRSVPGEFVKALHLGTPLVDLGLVLGGEESKKAFGFHVNGYPGILVDNISEFPEIISEFFLTDSLANTKGILIEKCAKTNRGLLPVLSLEKVFSVEFTVAIDEELSRREWI